MTDVVWEAWKPQACPTIEDRLKVVAYKVLSDYSGLIPIDLVALKTRMDNAHKAKTKQMPKIRTRATKSKKSVNDNTTTTSKLAAIQIPTAICHMIWTYDLRTIVGFERYHFNDFHFARTQQTGIVAIYVVLPKGIGKRLDNLNALSTSFAKWLYQTQKGKPLPKHPTQLDPTKSTTKLDKDSLPVVAGATIAAGLLGLGWVEYQKNPCRLGVRPTTLFYDELQSEEDVVTFLESHQQDENNYEMRQTKFPICPNGERIALCRASFMEQNCAAYLRLNAVIQSVNNLSHTAAQMRKMIFRQAETSKSVDAQKIDEAKRGNSDLMQVVTDWLTEKQNADSKEQVTDKQKDELLGRVLTVIGDQASNRAFLIQHGLISPRAMDELLKFATHLMKYEFENVCGFDTADNYCNRRQQDRKTMLQNLQAQIKITIQQIDALCQSVGITSQNSEKINENLNRVEILLLQQFQGQKWELIQKHQMIQTLSQAQQQQLAQEIRIRQFELLQIERQLLHLKFVRNSLQMLFQRYDHYQTQSKFLEIYNFEKMKQIWGQLDKLAYAHAIWLCPKPALEQPQYAGFFINYYKDPIHYQELFSLLSELRSSDGSWYYFIEGRPSICDSFMTKFAQNIPFDYFYYWFFQVIHGIAMMEKRYPHFLHNQLRLQNIKIMPHTNPDHPGFDYEWNSMKIHLWGPETKHLPMAVIDCMERATFDITDHQCDLTSTENVHSFIVQFFEALVVKFHQTDERAKQMANLWFSELLNLPPFTVLHAYNVMPWFEYDLELSSSVGFLTAKSLR